MCYQEETHATINYEILAETSVSSDDGPLDDTGML